MGDKGEGGHTIQQRETRRETSWETSWKTRETRPWEGGHTIQQRETRRDTRGDKTFGRRRHHPTQAHLGKANTASNTGTHVGDNGRQWEAMRAMGGIGRQELAKTRTCEGRHTIQHRHTYAGRLWETMGDKGRQDLGKADTAWDTRGDKGRQGETRPREGGHTIQHRHTCGETMGDKGRQGETRPREGGHCQKIIGYKKY